MDIYFGNEQKRLGKDHISKIIGLLEFDPR